MSACPVEEQWQTVSKGKGAKKKKGHARGRSIPREAEVLRVSAAGRIRQKIKEAQEELQSSEFWTICHKTVERAINKYHTAPPTIPLHHFLNVGTAEFLESRKDDADRCRTTMNLISQLSCLLFDPLFTEWEKRFLKDCGLVVIEENEEGKRSINQPTLFYMIHCGKALYNNLLWKNWSPQQLANTIIIGNSFKGIEERLPTRVLQRDYMYISNILAVTEETAFPYSNRYLDIFNDTSIHQFPRAKLDSKPTEFWANAAEPTYQQCEDLEIIQNG
ncbi:SRR1-like protein isoform X3 [Narcine bancroftii]|uniref:SRR1-like protein isoform X3 n=1 Tax=Narcine bancroftii TaxID=1343680 RepID=UPI0038312606